jgi:hypothetical protein
MASLMVSCYNFGIICMNKMARSSDPQQQALRDRKKSFNAASKEFIKRLIAFKKGINGRGDNSFGIPVSRIQDPLPREVLDMLGELSSNFEQLVNEANQITQEQTYYSEHRKQPQPKTVEPSAAKPEETPSPLAGLTAAVFSPPSLPLIKLAAVLAHKWEA